MPLTYVNQIGADNGIMQAAPNTMINETNLVWAQDILVDRTGYLRRRGPFTEVATNNLTDGEVVAGACSTHDPSGAWNMVTLASDSDSSRFVFYNTSGAITGWSWLPFKHPNGMYLNSNTEAQNNNMRFQNPMTMFSGRAALTGGAFLSLFTRYGVPVYSTSSPYPRFQSLYYWRGGHGIDSYAPSCTFPIEGAGAAAQFNRTFTFTTSALDSALTGETPAITTGMFVFDDISGNPGNCIGVIKSISVVGGTTSVTLEKRPMVGHISGGYDSTNHANFAQLTGKTIHFRNVRGFMPMHGRGLITIAAGNVVTSGLEGTDGEGHFGAAKMNEGDWYVYRNSDHALLGKVSPTGSMSNTQFTLSFTSGDNKLVLTSDEYVAVEVRTSADLSSDVNTSTTLKSLEPSPYYQPRISGNVDDSAGGTASYDSSVRSYKDVPGYLTATYAGLQWFGSLGQVGYENQLAFSGYHDPEAVDLSPDASDTIVIPGVNIMRGLASSASGLIVFMSDNTYILRGNDRTNFSLEVLYPEGCLSNGSIVEIGGGVMWAAPSGILYYDGASVRNLTKDNLGTYYYDSVKQFDANADRIYAFVYKNYLFMTFNKWNSSYSYSRFEPLYMNAAAGDTASTDLTWNGSYYSNESYIANGYTYDDMSTRVAAWGYERITNTIPFVTFALYLPSGAITTLSNFEFVGSVFLDAIDATSSSAELNYEKAWVAINALKRSNTEWVEGRYPNIVTSVSAPSAGKCTVTFNTTFSDGYNPSLNISNGSVVDLLDRNDDVVVSSAVVESLNSPTGTFKYAATSQPTNVVSFVKPQFKTHNRGVFVGVDDMLDVSTNDDDSFITFAAPRVGPDFYFQTKVYTVGDPVIRKWFQRLMINMLIKGGAVRIDMIDYENNDFVSTNLKEKNWVLLPEALYPWTTAQKLFLDLTDALQVDSQDPPQSGTSWGSLQSYATAGGLTWNDVLFPAFERRTKRFSIRTNALGYQFYQVNRFKPSSGLRANTVRAKRIETDAWSIGFKALRTGRQ